MITNELQQWELKDGVAFLQKIGVKYGQIVLDFGCRIGHYSIPAAKVVGDNGFVYAVDKDQEAIDNLKQKATELGIENIKVINSLGNITLDLQENHVDVVLLYDVLHYFDESKRRELYKEMWRILKKNGLLSVYPKHTKDDAPLDTFENLTTNDVKDEIEKSNFIFEKKYCDIISHDDNLNYGCVLNFRKFNG